jgi:DNA-binding NarL/FixJ family response regulator
MRKALNLRVSRRNVELGLAKVLLVHGNLAPRLALQTILQASGYSVDVAASPAEALLKLDESQYDLVLADTEFSSDVLPYARVKEYRPATAVVNSSEPIPDYRERHGSQLSVHTENLPNLLESVAERIGARARRRYRRARSAVKA